MTTTIGLIQPEPIGHRDLEPGNDHGNSRSDQQ